MTLKTLSLAVEFGSHQIYNQFIHEGVFMLLDLVPTQIGAHLGGEQCPLWIGVRHHLMLSPEG